MKKNPLSILSEFYGQALLNPELLCLNCRKTAWNQAACRCSSENRQECFLFATDMAKELGKKWSQDISRRRQISPTAPTS